MMLELESPSLPIHSPKSEPSSLDSLRVFDDIAPHSIALPYRHTPLCANNVEAPSPQEITVE